MRIPLTVSSANSVTYVRARSPFGEGSLAAATNSWSISSSVYR